jgi:hypothetical protein
LLSKLTPTKKDKEEVMESYGCSKIWQRFHLFGNKSIRERVPVNRMISKKMKYGDFGYLSVSNSSTPRILSQSHASQIIFSYMIFDPKHHLQGLHGHRFYSIILGRGNLSIQVHLVDI